MMPLNLLLIRSRVIVFLCIFLLCITIVLSSIFYLDSVRENKKTIQNELQSKQRSIVKLHEEISLINNYQKDYERIINQGFLDDENRLLWIEQLEATASKLDLPDLFYDISIQKKISNAYFSIPENVVLLESSFKFKSSILHEGDLLDLVAGLRNLNSGALALKNCQISRNENNITNTLVSNFIGSCDILLYTARYKDTLVNVEDEI